MNYEFISGIKCLVRACGILVGSGSNSFRKYLVRGILVGSGLNSFWEYLAHGILVGSGSGSNSFREYIVCGNALELVCMNSFRELNV